MCSNSRTIFQSSTIILKQSYLLSNEFLLFLYKSHALYRGEESNTKTRKTSPDIECGEGFPTKNNSISNSIRSKTTILSHRQTDLEYDIF